MTMIEKVARPMAEATEKMLPVRVWQSWDEMSTPAKAAYMVRARVAIEAMLEPSEEQISAFSKACDSNGQCLVKYGYQAMIKAALEEE